MKRLLFSLLFATALFGQSGGQTVWIPIQSPGFLGYGQTFSQDLGVTPENVQRTPTGYTDGIYTVHFSIENQYPPYPGKWELEITFGTQKLCDFYGWGLKRFRSVTQSCTSSGYIVVDQALPGGGPVQGKNNLVATWSVNDGSSNGGWAIQFKDAWMTFTPID